MIKKYILAGALLAGTLNVCAQNVNKLIDQTDVDRIIKTLSADDMQGRATFTPGIEKAAQFIEGEFKDIGLQPFPGNTGTSGFRQNFAMASIAPVSASVIINGKTMAADSVVVRTSAAAINWDNSSDVQVVKLSADKNFATESAAYAASGKKMLILTDPKFFANLKGRRGGGRMLVNDGQVLVYVIGKFDEVKSYQVNYTAKVMQMPLFNVAGIIPGKTKPNEYVVFSGHYDHLGIVKGNRVMEGDSIANGADDDASGTTAMITLAKYYKKLNNNARTLVFVAFCAEEIGEYGSQHFATTINPDKVVAMFNIEMIGKASKFGPNSAIITGYERSDFGKILQKNLKGTAFKFYPDPYTDQNLFYRSDNASLARVGVPAHTISTDQIDIDKLYHTVKDEYSSLDVANITSTIRAIALSSRTIVSGKDTPTRVAKLER
jgi:Zn-dependent M28 family amino/carboxypeptidase